MKRMEEGNLMEWSKWKMVRENVRNGERKGGTGKRRNEGSGKWKEKMEAIEKRQEEGK